MYSEYHLEPGGTVDVSHAQESIDNDHSWQNGLAEEETGTDLPAGWVQYQSDDGWPYYYNAELNISSWEHPSISYPTSYPSVTDNEGSRNDISDPSQTAERDWSSEYEENLNYSLSADSHVQEVASVTLQLNLATITASTAQPAEALGRTPYTASSAVSAVTAEEFFSPFTPAGSGASVEGMDRFSVGSDSPLAGLSGFGTDLQQKETAEADDRSPQQRATGNGDNTGNHNESGHSLALSGSLHLSSPSFLADLSTAEDGHHVDQLHRSLSESQDAPAESPLRLHGGSVDKPAGDESLLPPSAAPIPAELAGRDSGSQEPQPLATQREAQQSSREARQLALDVESQPPQQQPPPCDSLPEVPLELSPASVLSGAFAAPQMRSQGRSHDPAEGEDTYPQSSAHLPPRGQGTSPRDAHLFDRHLHHPHALHPLLSPTTPSSGESELFQCLSSSMDGDGTPSMASLSRTLSHSLSQAHSHMCGEGDSGLSSVASALVAAAQVAPAPTAFEPGADAEEGTQDDYGLPPPPPASAWEIRPPLQELVQQFPPPRLPPPPSAVSPVAEDPPGPGAYSPVLSTEEDASGIETPGRPVFYSPTTAQAADVAAMISDDSDEDTDIEKRTSGPPAGSDGHGAQQQQQQQQQQLGPQSAPASVAAMARGGWPEERGASGSGGDGPDSQRPGLHHAGQYGPSLLNDGEELQSAQGGGAEPAWTGYSDQGEAEGDGEQGLHKGGTAEADYQPYDYNWQEIDPHNYDQQQQSQSQSQQHWGARDLAEGRDVYEQEVGGLQDITEWDGQAPAEEGPTGVPTLSAHQVAWLQYEQLRDSGAMAATEAAPLATLDHQHKYQYQQELFMTATLQSSSQQEMIPPTSKYGRLRAVLQQGKGRGFDASNKGAQSTATAPSGPSLLQDEEEFFEAQPGNAMPGLAQAERWQQCVTAQGDVYYYNLDTQHVQWENPYDEPSATATATDTATDTATATATAYQGLDQAGAEPQPQQQQQHQPQQQDSQLGPQQSLSAAWGEPDPQAADSIGAGSSSADGRMISQALHSGNPAQGRQVTASPAATSAPGPAPRRGMVTRNSVAASATSAATLLQEAQATGTSPPHSSSYKGTPSASVASVRAPTPAWSAPAATAPEKQATERRDQADALYDRNASYAASQSEAYAQQAGAQSMYQSMYRPPDAPAVSGEEPGVESDEDEGDRSTVGSPTEMAGTYGRHAPFGNRASTRSISSLSDNESSEYGYGYGYGGSVQSSVQGAFVLGAPHHPYVPGVSTGRPSPYGPAATYAPDSPAQPSGGAYALSPSSGYPESGWVGRISPAAPASSTGPSNAGGGDGGDAASQASSESQKQRHLEIWDRFFRNAMLISQRTEGYADESHLSRNAVSESIRKIRQKAAMSRSKGATAVARWPHALPQRRYAALVRLALRKGGATESHVSDADVSDLNAEERAVVESGSVAGSVTSIDGTLLSMALLAACLHEDLAAAQRLLQSGANPSCVDDQLRTPAHYCAKSGHTDLLALLCDHDADLEATDAAGRSPLHTAAIFGRTAVMEFLLGCAVDCNAADLAGNTPLHLAARAGFAEGCSLLLRFGAAPGSRNLMGMTAQGVAQVMRPQTAALQHVVAVLSSPPNASGGEMGGITSAGLATNKKYDRQWEADSLDHRSQTSKPDFSGGGAGRRQEQAESVTPGNGTGRGSNTVDPGDDVPQRNGGAAVYQEWKSENVKAAEEAWAEEYEVGEDIEEEGDETEEDEEGEGEGSSVADVVASSVWGVAATLIDITLSMFSGPSGSGGEKAAKGRVSRAEPRERTGWGLFSAPDRDGVTSKTSEGATSTGSLQGLAGGPPTDRELRERGLGFPAISAPVAADGGVTGSRPPLPPPPVGIFAPPPAIVAREIDRQVEALRSSAASTPSRGGGSAGYVPPTPPSEVMVAVALSRAEQQRQQQQAATRPAASMSLMDGMDDAEYPYAPAMPRFHAPQGGYLVPPEALPPGSEDSASPTPEEPTSPPTSGNGYSLGNTLPKGVTWRYVDVLSNQK